MALILKIIILIVIRMYLLINVITMLMIPMQQALPPFQLPCSEYTNCACVIKFHLGKCCPIGDQIFLVVETVFFQSIWRYHLVTLRPEFYYKCNWNGARIMLIVQQTKKWFVWKIIIWSRFCQFCHSPVLYINNSIWSCRWCW